MQYDSVMPGCIRKYTLKDTMGKVLIHVEKNYQAINSFTLPEPITTTGLRLQITSTGSNIFPALMGIIIKSN